MSHITTMAINDGIIMLGDRLVGGRARILKRKLFSTGNIGLSCLCHFGNEKEGMPLGESGAIAEFCKTNSFNSPKEAAEKFYQYLKDDLCKKFGISIYVAHIAGYNGVPEMYRISNLEEDRKITTFGSSELKFFGNKGFMQYGCGGWYAEQYADMINSQKGLSLLNNYTLQDALDFSKLIHTMCRGLMKHLERKEEISEEIDVLALTSEGIQWLRKEVTL